MGEYRSIAHIDMDAFFAAVEQRDNPSYRGKPVIVGADPKGGKGRGVVATCSYEARVYGVHSAMPISQAYRLCPQGIYVHPDGERYSQASRVIHGIFREFTPSVEPVSIDEAYLDITETWHLFAGSPREVCAVLKKRIRSATGLTASVGLAPTKMAAKIASDLKKPDGLVEVIPEELQDFLRPLDISRLWGLGKKSAELLYARGIRTIGELARQDARELAALFGSSGLHFLELAQGRDSRIVESGHETKSVSSETTFEKDTRDTVKIGAALVSLCDDVSRHLREDGLKGRTVTLKVRLSGFETYTRAHTLCSATNYCDVIGGEAKRLFQAFEYRDRPVRLVGVRVSNLSPADFPDSLFADRMDKQRESVHKAVEVIRGRFGGDAIQRAGTIA